MELAEIRTKIDETDREIRELLLKRMGYSHQVAEAKIESGDTTIYRADREASILENLGDSVDEEVRSEYLSVVRKIMETSRMYQYGLIFDWTPGAFESINGHELVSSTEALAPGAETLVSGEKAPHDPTLRSPEARTGSASLLDRTVERKVLPSKFVTVRLTREDKPNAMSAILSMIGDYGYNMDRMVPVADTIEGCEPTEAENDRISKGIETDDAFDCGAIELEEAVTPENLGNPKKKETVTFDLTILGNLAETNMQKLMFQLNGESLDFEILACE